MEPSSRKLHVAETLAKATRALEAHRSWMKRRASAVTPLEQDEEDTFQTNNEHLTRDLQTRTSKYVRSSKKEHSVGKIEQNHIEDRGAPPPFMTKQLYLGSSVSEVSQKSTLHPMSLKNVRSTKDTLDSDDTNGQEEQNSSKHTRNPEGDITAPKHRVKGRRKLSQVAPSEKVGDMPQSPVNVNMFLTGDNVAMESPPHARIHNAWGSQTSLDNHGNSSISGTKQQMLSVSTNSDDTPSLSTCLTNGEQKPDDNFNSEPSIQLDTHIHVQDESQGASMLKDHSTEKHLVSIPNEDLHDGESSPHQSEENSFESAQIGELQANNLATVIPVSPAPVGQRSSYTAHTQSKLMAAEDNVEMLDIQAESRKHTIHPHDNIVVNSEHGFQGDHQVVPEAVLHNVLPNGTQSNGESFKTTAHSSSPMQLSDRNDSETDNNPSITRSTSLPVENKKGYPEMPRVKQDSLSSLGNVTTHYDDPKGLKHELGDIATTKVLKDLHLPPLKKVDIGNNSIKICSIV